MENNLHKMTEERNQLYMDVRAGKIPKRVPINLNMDGAAALEYAGYDLKTQQYDIKYLIDAMEKAAQDFESDNLGVTAVRFAHLYKILGAKHFVMGTDGFLQHPEIAAMEPKEYDVLIAEPYQFYGTALSQDCILSWISLGPCLRQRWQRASIPFTAPWGRLGPLKMSCA